MTTEIWIPGFRENTLRTIPDSKRLDSAQKSLLISDLKKYFPPVNRRNVKDISPNQFGQIIDKVNNTQISTTSKIIVATYNPDTDYIFENSTLETYCRPWKNPVIISNQNNQIACLHLPGYSKRIPIFIRNINII